MSNDTFIIHRFSSLPNLVSDLLFCTLLVLAGLIASEAHADSHSDTGANLQFTVDNIRSADGSIMIAVLASEAAFADKEQPTASLILPAQLGQISVNLEGFPAGEYAIRVMHDVDANGKLKTNMLGMPKEPWGMSNNATGKFGPPKWADAKFEVPSTAPQVISLQQ